MRPISGQRVVSRHEFFPFAGGMQISGEVSNKLCNTRVALKPEILYYRMRQYFMFSGSINLVHINIHDAEISEKIIIKMNIYAY